MPRVSLDGALSHEVCVCLTCQRSQKFDTSWYSACSCIVVPVGDPYASGALSAFVRVSRQQQKHTVMYSLWYCVMFVFFLVKYTIFKFKFIKPIVSVAMSNVVWLVKTDKLIVSWENDNFKFTIFSKTTIKYTLNWNGPFQNAFQCSDNMI